MRRSQGWGSWGPAWCSPHKGGPSRTSCTSCSRSSRATSWQVGHLAAFQLGDARVEGLHAGEGALGVGLQSIPVTVGPQVPPVVPTAGGAPRSRTTMLSRWSSAVEPGSTSGLSAAAGSSSSGGCRWGAGGETHGHRRGGGARCGGGPGRGGEGGLTATPSLSNT